MNVRIFALGCWLVFSLGWLFDLGTTQIALQQGLAESNPYWKTRIEYAILIPFILFIIILAFMGVIHFINGLQNIGTMKK